MLAQIAEPYQVVVDQSVASDLEGSRELQAAQIVDLQGTPLHVCVLGDRADDTT
jgi:hypothetical protein